MSDSEIEAAAAAIREHLQMLLSDYSGDELLRADEDEEQDPIRRLVAQVRLHVYDELMEKWCENNGANEERMIHAAREALEAAAKSRAHKARSYLAAREALEAAAKSRAHKARSYLAAERIEPGQLVVIDGDGMIRGKTLEAGETTTVTFKHTQS